jgi:hypothetical protein
MKILYIFFWFLDQFLLIFLFHCCIFDTLQMLSFSFFFVLWHAYLMLHFDAVQVEPASFLRHTNWCSPHSHVNNIYVLQKWKIIHSPYIFLYENTSINQHKILYLSHTYKKKMYIRKSFFFFFFFMAHILI